MIAAFEERGELHVVYSVARKGLKAVTVGYCRTEHNAGDGTLQVPDWIFDGRVQAPQTFGNLRVCKRCSDQVKLLHDPPVAAATPLQQVP